MTRKELEAFVKGTAPAIRAFVTAQVAPLERRIKELEQRVNGKSDMTYHGVWKPQTSYDANSVVTHGGSAWHTKVYTSAVPGGPAATDRDWVLMVKRGRDGKDAPMTRGGPS